MKVITSLLALALLSTSAMADVVFITPDAIASEETIDINNVNVLKSDAMNASYEAPSPVRGAKGPLRTRYQILILLPLIF